MVSNEILGISILGAIAFVILALYLCKCYYDCTVGQNRTKKTVSDQDVSLLEACQKHPLPHDPYADDDEFVDKDHNDLGMVLLSIEKFHRKQSFENSALVQLPKSKSLLTTQHEPTGIQIDKPIEQEQISPAFNNELDGLKSPTTFASKRKVYEQTIEAPVTVHHTPHPPTVNKPPNIYAAVDKTQRLPIADTQAPTYFRPVTKATTPKVPPKHGIAVMYSAPPPSYLSEMVTQPVNVVNTPTHDQPVQSDVLRDDHKNAGPIASIQRTTNDNGSKENISKAKQSTENIPPNKQNVEEEHLFFIPDSVVSPRTPRKGRKNSERTLQTLDDIVTEMPRTPKSGKKNKKSTANKTDANKPTTPKPHRKRKKSVADIVPDPEEIKHPHSNGAAQVEPISGTESRHTPYSGMCSPPIPPRNPQNNPLLSPATLRSHNNMQVWTSEL